MTDYPRPSLTADCIVFAVDGAGVLRALFIQRKKDPFAGSWAFPGGFCEPTENVGQAAARELAEETGLRGVDLEEIGVFSEPGRDPRGWVVSVAHLGFVPWSRASEVVGSDDAALARWLAVRREGERPYAELEGDAVKLAFDHAAMLALALRRAGDRVPVARGS